MPLPVRSNENFHIVLWLLKDLCWVMDLRMAGAIMIVPTVGMAVFIAWQLRHDTGELLHSLAVVCWIFANSTWMIGEFFLDDSTRTATSVLFAIGLVLILWYYAVVLPRRRLIRKQSSARS